VADGDADEAAVEKTPETPPATRSSEDEESPTEAELMDLDPKVEAHLTRMMMEHYSGPFPHPEHLERYAALYPRAPEVIFNTFEAQSDHRREMESITVEGNETRANRGQWLAYSLVVIALGIGLTAVLTGQAVTGGVIVTAAFTGGVVLYIAGGNAKNRAPARSVSKTSGARATATSGNTVEKPKP
jgi:hypothetical protein